MRVLSFLLASLVVAGASAQETTPLGQGIAVTEFEDGTQLRFYRDTTDALPAHVVDSRFDDSRGFHLSEGGHSPEWLRPESIWLDYYQLFFRVTERSPQWVQVIVHNENDLRFWLPRGEGVRFVSWAEFLTTEVLCVAFRYGGQVYEQPDEQAEGYRPEGCLVVKEVKGHWARVIVEDPCTYADEFQRNPRRGWIRWREGEEILVTYFTRCW